MNKELEEKLVAAKAELKSQMVKILFDFTDKYAAPDAHETYPHTGYLIVGTLIELLREAEYQVAGTPAFTQKQIDHICYQIGDWYLMVKTLLECQHNLGHMKERLKIMICGGGE